MASVRVKEAAQSALTQPRGVPRQPPNPPENRDAERLDESDAAGRGQAGARSDSLQRMPPAGNKRAHSRTDGRVTTVDTLHAVRRMQAELEDERAVRYPIA